MLKYLDGNGKRWDFSPKNFQNISWCSRLVIILEFVCDKVLITASYYDISYI